MLIAIQSSLILASGRPNSTKTSGAKVEPDKNYELRNIIRLKLVAGSFPAHGPDEDTQRERGVFGS